MRFLRSHDFTITLLMATFSITFCLFSILTSSSSSIIVLTFSSPYAAVS